MWCLAPNTLICLYPEGPALLAAFPNNASHCAADVRLSCLRARKTQISDEVEQEMQEEAKRDCVERLFSPLMSSS